MSGFKIIQQWVWMWDHVGSAPSVSLNVYKLSPSSNISLNVSHYLLSLPATNISLTFLNQSATACNLWPAKHTQAPAVNESHAHSLLHRLHSETHSLFFHTHGRNYCHESQSDSRRRRSFAEQQWKHSLLSRTLHVKLWQTCKEKYETGSLISKYSLLSLNDLLYVYEAFKCKTVALKGRLLSTVINYFSRLQYYQLSNFLSELHQLFSLSIKDSVQPGQKLHICLNNTNSACLLLFFLSVALFDQVLQNTYRITEGNKKDLSCQIIMTFKWAINM